MPAIAFTIGKSRFEAERGDITSEKTDAIVNAANSGLRGGGGVDGAIHRAGGPSIMVECRKIGRCPTGKAVITGGGKLKAKWVVHAVGPIHAGIPADKSELSSAYNVSMTRAKEVGARSVAFPAISTGAYGYPIKEAAAIAIRTVCDFVTANPEDFDLIRFILFTDADYAAYFAEFTKRGAGHPTIYR